MPTTIADDDEIRDACEELLPILLDAKPRKLERLAQFALGSLLAVPFRHARPGDQEGGDGGVSGVGGRNIVFEARRYGPNSRLDERGIRGEIDQAAERHPDLEAWLLVTTVEVPQQLQDAMDRTALGRGVSVISIDWLRCPLPKLAVLAASCPDYFVANFGRQHRALLEQIAGLPGYAPPSDTTRFEMPVTGESEKYGVPNEGRSPSSIRMWPVAKKLLNTCAAQTRSTGWTTGSIVPMRA